MTTIARVHRDSNRAHCPRLLSGEYIRSYRVKPLTQLPQTVSLFQSIPLLVPGNCHRGNVAFHPWVGERLSGIIDNNQYSISGLKRVGITKDGIDMHRLLDSIEDGRGIFDKAIIEKTIRLRGCTWDTVKQASTLEIFNAVIGRLGYSWDVLEELEPYQVGQNLMDVLKYKGLKPDFSLLQATHFLTTLDELTLVGNLHTYVEWRKFNIWNTGKTLEQTHDQIYPATADLLREVAYDGHNIVFIANPTLDVMRAAMASDPLAIGAIENPPEEIVLFAIDLDPLAISKVIRPTEKAQIAAISVDPTMIGKIVSPAPKVQLMAVKKKPELITLIHNPSEEVQLYILEHRPDLAEAINNPTESVQARMVAISPESLRSFKVPSLEAQKAAVSQNGLLIKDIAGASEEVQLLAVQQNGEAIQFIENPSFATKLAAVKQNGFALRFLSKPSATLIEAATSQLSRSKKS